MLSCRAGGLTKSYGQSRDTFISYFIFFFFTFFLGVLGVWEMLSGQLLSVPIHFSLLVSFCIITVITTTLPKNSS